MTNFKLVNPLIVGGDMNNTYSCGSQKEAAENAWKKLSKYISGSVPRFAFTIERTSDGKLYHYVVKEKVKGESVDFSIKELDLKLNKNQVAAFKEQILNVTDSVQRGGKKHDDSSSSDDDSDSSEIYEKIKAMRAKSLPFSYMWYNPVIYTVESFGTTVLESVYIPTFTVPVAPFFEINFSSAFFRP